MAIFISMTLCTTIYLFVNVAYFSILTSFELSASPAVANTVANLFLQVHSLYDFIVLKNFLDEVVLCICMGTAVSVGKKKALYFRQVNYVVHFLSQSVLRR